MERENDRFELLTRRALLLGGMQAALASVLIGRLFSLQIIKGEKYKLMSENNRISLRIIAPPRGQIVDRFGVPLAVNQQSFQAYLVPEEVQDMDFLFGNLANILGLTDAEKKKILRDAKRGRGSLPVAVRDNLSWEQVTKLEVNKPDLPGISVEAGNLRQYPLGDSTAHVIGYVASASEEEAAKDPALGMPGIKIGKSGIEKMCENDLRGTAGTVQMEVNAAGRSVRELARTKPQPGQAVALTLDAELQHFVQERLSTERSAAAVVMDAVTGALYAMASYPAFDPNVFSSGIPQDVWEQLLADETNPLTNKTIAGQYPPGSTFKLCTALTALEAGVMTPDSTVFCPGYVDLGEHRFHCWKKEGHGTVSLTHALAQSCDVYFYEMGRRAQIDRLATMARRLGLGQKSGIDFPNEKPGLVPDRAWKRKRFKEQWQMGETFVNAIGQGYMLTTPLQLATMTARIVNGGYAVSPYLVQGRERGSAPPINVSQVNLASIMAGMQAVVSPGGTANAAQIKEPGLQMAGKTGTSQVRRISEAQRSAGFDVNKLPWEQRHHALFVGYAPLVQPRYVTCVIVEHGASGAGAAAPAAADILRRAQQRDPAKGVG